MEITLEQALKQIRDGLAGISVPVSHIDTIGAQILGAVKSLDSCLDAIEKARDEKASEEKEGSEENVHV